MKAVGQAQPEPNADNATCPPTGTKHGPEESVSSSVKPTSSVEIFPTKFFGAVWGTSSSLCTLSGGGREVLLRCCRQSILFFSPMSWYCSKFRPAKVSHN